MRPSMSGNCGLVISRFECVQRAVLVDPAIGEAGDIDTSMLILKLPGGALCHIDNSRRTTYGYDERIEVFGSKGMVQSRHKPTREVSLYTGGLGIKMAAPDRDVYVMVGDGSYLMMNSEIVTSIQENYKLIIVLLDNNGFKSIGALSRSLGQDGFGTRYVYPRNGVLPDDRAGMDIQSLPVDLAANARSLGAHVIECQTYADFEAALEAVRTTNRTSVIYIQNDRYVGIPGYESWWDVPIAEVSEMPQVEKAHTEWAEMRTLERHFLG